MNNQQSDTKFIAPHIAIHPTHKLCSQGQSLQKPSLHMELKMMGIPCKKKNSYTKTKISTTQNFQRKNHLRGVSILHGIHYSMLIDTEHKRSKTRVHGSNIVFPEFR
jgi:hypothetical protein